MCTLLDWVQICVQRFFPSWHDGQHARVGYIPRGTQAHPLKQAQPLLQSGHLSQIACSQNYFNVIMHNLKEVFSRFNWKIHFWCKIRYKFLRTTRLMFVSFWDRVIHKSLIIDSQNCDAKKYLAPLVQKLDNAIHRINHYPADSVVCFVNIYPLDSDLSGG